MSVRSMSSRRSAKFVERGCQRPHQRRLQRLEHQLQAGNRGQRLAQRDQIARPGGAERGARDQPLQVVDGLQRLAELALAQWNGTPALPPRRDGRESRSSVASGRSSQPRSRRPPIDVIVRSISSSSEPFVSALAAGNDLQVLERDRIDDQAVAGGLVGDRADVREVGFLRVAQIRRQPARGLDGGRPALEAEPVEAVDPELIEECAPRGFRLERPGIGRGHRQLQPGDVGQPIDDLPRRHHDFPRTQHGDLVGERLQAVAAAIFRGGEFARGQVDQRDTIQVARRGDRHQIRRLARLEIGGVGERARGDDADDLALDETLGLLRILGLFADGDAEALLDQARHVAVGRVDGARRTSGCRCRRRPSTATSASARALALPPARPRRTSRRSRPCGRRRWHRDTDASRPGTAASPG